MTELKDYKLEIASNIRRARLAKKYSQDYLAAGLNISQNAYSKIERGYTKLTLRHAFIIADILKADVLTILRPGQQVQLPVLNEIAPG